MIIINFDMLFTCNPTPTRLHIKIFMPDGPNITMRESQSPVKFGQISLKIPIQKLKFNIKRTALKMSIPIYNKGAQKFPTQALIDWQRQAQKLSPSAP